MTVNVDGGCRTPSPEPQALLILLEEETSKQVSDRMATLPETQKLSDKPPTPPIFFRHVIVSIQFIKEWSCYLFGLSPWVQGVKDPLIR
jgi:hypothetical protein